MANTVLGDVFTGSYTNDSGTTYTRKFCAYIREPVVSASSGGQVTVTVAYAGVAKVSDGATEIYTTGSPKISATFNGVTKSKTATEHIKLNGDASKTDPVYGRIAENWVWTVDQTSQARELTMTFKYTKSYSWGGTSEGKTKVIIPALASYTISYDANGGSSAPASTTKMQGTAATITYSEPTRSGYTFLGWSTSSSATSAQYVGGSSYTTDADVLLYAVWQQNVTYTVILDPRDGSSATPYSGYSYGSSFYLPTLQRANYSFQGWSTVLGSSAVYSGSTYMSVYSNITLYAVWQETTIYYSVQLYDSVTKTTSSYGTVEQGNVVTIPSPTNKTGYEFQYWTDQNGNQYQPGNVFNIYQNTTLTSHWLEKDIDIEFIWGSGVTITGTTPAPYTKTYKYTTILGTLPTNASNPWDITVTYKGYGFKGWKNSDGNVVTNNTTIASISNGQLTAYWIAKQANVTFRSNNKDVAIEGIDNGEPYPTFPIVTKTGYTFIRWKDSITDETVNQGDIFNYGKDQILLAEWAPHTCTSIINWNWAGASASYIPSGSNIITTTTQTYDQSINWKDMYGNEMTEPVRPGYKLYGFSNNKNEPYTSQNLIKWKSDKNWSYPNESGSTTQIIYAIWGIETSNKYNRTGSIDTIRGCVFKRDPDSKNNDALKIALPIYTSILNTIGDTDESKKYKLLNGFSMQTFISFAIGTEKKGLVDYYTGQIDRTPQLSDSLGIFETDTYCVKTIKDYATTSSIPYNFSLNYIGTTKIGTNIVMDLSTTDHYSPQLDQWPTSSVTPTQKFDYQTHYFIRVYCYTNVYKTSDNNETPIYLYTLPIEVMDNFITKEYMTLDISAEGREIAIGGAASDDHDGIEYLQVSYSSGDTFNKTVRYYKINESGSHELMQVSDETYQTLAESHVLYTTSQLPEEAHIALYGYIDCGTWNT